MAPKWNSTKTNKLMSLNWIKKKGYTDPRTFDQIGKPLSVIRGLASLRRMDLKTEIRIRVSPFLRYLPDKLLSPVLKFARDGWNQRLFSDLGLDVKSRVVDIGGYVGDSTNEIVSRFGSRVFVFEPVPDFVRQLNLRFKDNELVEIFGFGIASQTCKKKFELLGDETTVLDASKTSTKNVIEVPFMEVSKVAELISWGAHLQAIDLAIINIEGGEYELIPTLSDANLLQYTKTILIQFHQISAESRLQRSEVREILATTHKLTYSYDWLWERWDKNRLE
jgi:FkbM family methyltransferase